MTNYQLITHLSKLQHKARTAYRLSCRACYRRFPPERAPLRLLQCLVQHQGRSGNAEVDAELGREIEAHLVERLDDRADEPDARFLASVAAQAIAAAVFTALPNPEFTKQSEQALAGTGIEAAAGPDAVLLPKPNDGRDIERLHGGHMEPVRAQFQSASMLVVT